VTCSPFYCNLPAIDEVWNEINQIRERRKAIVNLRRSICLGLAVLMIVATLPLLAAMQEPARGGGGGQGRGGAGGGGGRGGAPPTNLQVLPKDWTRQQVVQVMQTFTMGLGVGCNYCHAEMAGAQPGANGQIPLDAASDEKQQKKTARVMMKMMTDVNAKLDSELGKSTSAPNGRVQCATCHRGAAIPKLQ
jgi:Photosynthetic reaction centre cytochrome C subunit